MTVVTLRKIMTKICLITDTHFGGRGDSVALLDHQERFFTEVFFPTLEKEGVDTILHLGDTFDRRKVVNFDTLHRVKNFFFEPLKKFNYHVITGNHDCYYSNTNLVNSTSLLHEVQPNHHIYTDDFVELDFDGTRIAMCPWINRENRDKLVKSIEQSKAHYLLGHFAIDGVEMMKGRVHEGGLRQELFQHYYEVFSGHFHHPSTNGNIIYLGAPYEMDWSDFEGERGFFILDTKKRKRKLIKNPYALHQRLVYEDEDLTVADVTELDVTPLRGSFVKVIVKKKTNPYLFDQFVAKVNDVGAADVKVVEDSLDLADVTFDDDLDAVEDTRGILKRYVEDIPDMDENISKKLSNFVDQLYVEAMDL